MINRDVLKLFGYEQCGLGDGWDHEVWYHDPSDTWVHFGKADQKTEMHSCWDNFYMEINGDEISSLEFIQLHWEHNNKIFHFIEIDGDLTSA